MRLILDQGVPHDAAALLRDLGYDCTHVGEIGMSRATNEEIVAASLERRAVVVTLDADFHAILAVSGAPGPSVIRMRLQGWAPQRWLSWFERSWAVSKLNWSVALWSQ